MTTTAAAPSRRSSTLVAAGIMLSRIAGLARERAMSHYLGLGIGADAFRAAMRIPNVLQNLFGEGVLSASFIPVYSRLLADGDDEEAGRVAGAIAGLLALAAGVLVVAGVVFAEPITAVLAVGFTGARFDLAVELTRITLPGVGLLVLSAWCLGVLNSHRRFFLSYVAPVVWNVAQIGALVAVGTRGASESSLAEALAWGALAGAALQFAVQLPAVRRLERHLRVSLRTDLPGVRTAVRRFVPVMAGRGVVQLSAWLDLFLASLLAVGAVAALGYAQILALLPVSLFAMSIAAAELPELSRMAPADLGSAAVSAAVSASTRARLESGLGRIAFFVVPTVVLYFVIGDLIVGALLRTGSFGGAETRLVWYVLCGYAVGLVAVSASRLLQSALYAAGDTRTPAKAAALRVAVAVVLGVVLMFQFDRLTIDASGITGWDNIPAPLNPLPSGVRGAADQSLRLGALGLSVASGLAAWIELALLSRRIRGSIGRVRLGGGQLGPVTAGALAAGGTALAVRLLAPGLPDIVLLALAGGLAGAVHLWVCTALGVPEAGALVGGVRRRLTRPGRAAD